MKKLLSVLLCLTVIFCIPFSVQAAQPERVNEVHIYSIEAQSVKIKWKCVEKATAYELFCSTSRSGGYQNIQTVQNLNNSKKLKLKIKNLEPKTKYYFKIRAVSGSKKSKCSKPVMVITKSLISEENPNYTIIRQNDPLNRKIPYHYNFNGKTIGSSGCGVCASLMVIKNTTNYRVDLKDYTYQCLATECRLRNGSSMLRIAELMNMFYSTDYFVTNDNQLLKEHLEKGYMATAHVGFRRYFSSLGGHFVTVAGVIKGATPEEDRVIILDPSFTEKKYSDKKRINVGIEYTPDGLVIAPFETLFADCKDECYILFTPEKRVQKSDSKSFVPKPFVEGEDEIEPEIRKYELQKKKELKKKEKLKKKKKTVK